MQPIYTLASLAFFAGALPALAGGPINVTPEPAPIVVAPAPQITDWSGFYAGLGVNRWGGDATNNGATLDYNNKTKLSGFVGYNVQNGAFVYGAELGFSPSIGAMIDHFTADDRLEDMLDLRARLGYATGNALFYGAVGYSRGKMELNGVPGDVKLSGTSIGIGMDYKFTDTFFAGIDYTHRNLDGHANVNNTNIDSDVNTVSLRLGFRF